MSDLRFTPVAPPSAREFSLVLVAGVLYVAAVLLRHDVLPSFFPGGPDVEHQALIQMVGFLLMLPAVLCLLAALSTRGSALRRSLRISGAWTVPVTVFLTIVISIVLNAMTLWPFTWRWPSSGAHAYAELLVRRGAWVAIGFWGVTGGIVTPLIEEVIVRFGLLRAILQHTSSGKTAVMTTSVLFALAHVGLPTWPPAIPYFSNAAWLFLASLLVGHLTVRSAGNITIALTAHLSRNALEFCLLLAAAL